MAGMWHEEEEVGMNNRLIEACGEHKAVYNVAAMNR